jgi:hypothetical protein
MSSLIEHLVTNRIVGFLQMDAAVQRVRREGGRLSTSLLEEADVDDERLIKEIADFEGISAVTDEMLAGTDDDLVLSWSAKRARKLGAIPLRIHGHDLDVGVLEPLSDLERGIISEEFGCDVHQYLMLEFRFFELLGRYFGAPVEGRYLRLATRFPLEKARLPGLQTDDDEEIEEEQVAEQHDSLENAFDEVAARDEAPSSSQPEEAHADAAAWKPPSGVGARDAISDEKPAAEDDSSSFETPPDRSSANYRATTDAETNPNAEPSSRTRTSGGLSRDDVWAAVKEESGLLEIPDLQGSSSLRDSPVDSNEQTAPEIDSIVVPEDPATPLESASWSFEELSEFYQFVNDRDQALLATLGFMRRFFARRMFMRFQGDQLFMHVERGYQFDRDAGEVAIDVRPLSGLDAMRQGQDYFHGPPSQIGMDRLYEAMGVKVPNDMIVLPVTVGERTVMLFVGDSADSMIDPKDLALAFVVRRQISDCLELLILRERRNTARVEDKGESPTEREKKVIERLTGNFKVPEIPTDDRGLVSLPTEGWDLPDAFEKEVGGSPDDGRVSIEGPVARSESDRRDTPGYDDQDIVRQVSEDSGWFDIDTADDVVNEDRTKSSAPGQGGPSESTTSLPRALSKQAQSDSYPHIDPSMPGSPERQEERTANFKAVSQERQPGKDSGMTSYPAPGKPGSGSEPSIPDHQVSGSDQYDTLDEHHELSEEEIALLEKAGIRAKNQQERETSAPPVVGTQETDDDRLLEEALAEEYKDYLSRDSSDTRELNVATASRLIQESSDAGRLPTEDDAEDGEDDSGSSPKTLMLSPDMRVKPGSQVPQSGSQPRVETLRTVEHPAAKAKKADTEDRRESSELIDIRQMREELEVSDHTRGDIDQSLKTILTGDADEIAEAVAEIVSRPAARLPYLANIFPGPLHLDRTNPEEAALPVYEHGPLLQVMYERLPSYIEQLWACVGQSDPNARYYALRLLAFVRELELRNQFVEALFDADNDVRRLALQLVHNHRHQVDLHGVIRLMGAGLESDNEHLVESAIITLTKLRAKEMIPKLTLLLDHPNQSLRQRALESLTRLTFQSSELGKDDWEEWFDQHGNEPEELWLVRAMTSENRERRKIAAKFLHRMPRLAVNYHTDISERQRRIARRTVEQYFGLHVSEPDTTST